MVRNLTRVQTELVIHFHASVTDRDDSQTQAHRDFMHMQTKS